MIIPIQRTAVVLLASGLSRRFGSKDKLLADLGGRPLVDHAAQELSGLDALTKIAVCPNDKREIGERLHDRFVIAVNKKPKRGLGHSIAVGVSVAMQFKPDAVVLAMGDMPFIERPVIEGVVNHLGHEGANIVHCGEMRGTRPPTAFDRACFEALTHLDGDDGARAVVAEGRFRVIGLSAPAPLLADVDTREDLELARRQMMVRERYIGPKAS
jgi:molybdenum cofactor cytidylyltransferase